MSDSQTNVENLCADIMRAVQPKGGRKAIDWYLVGALAKRIDRNCVYELKARSVYDEINARHREEDIDSLRGDIT